MKICTQTGVLITDSEAELNDLCREGKVFDKIGKIEIFEDTEETEFVKDGFVKNDRGGVRKVFDGQKSELISVEGNRIPVQVVNKRHLDFLLDVSQG